MPKAIPCMEETVFEVEGGVMKLLDACELIVDCPHSTAKDEGSGYPLIRTPNVGRGRLKLEGVHRVSYETYCARNERAVPQTDDLILAREAPVGNVAIIKEGQQVCLGQRTVLIRSNKNIVEPDFLVYYLLSPEMQHMLLSAANGATVSHLNMADIRKLEISLPDLEVQKKIGRLLSTIEDKIETNNEINDNLLQQAQAIYMHIFGDNSSVTAATIADIALNVTDGVHNTVKDDPEGQYLLLSCKNIKGGLLSIGSSERKINSETFEKLRRRTKLAKGDILISSVGTVGELLLLNTDPSNYEFQRSVAIVKPNPELVSSAYVYESLVAKKAELINAAHGAVQQCLFISDIAGFPIGIPNPAELRSFDEVVKPMFDTITANEAENLRLEALRDTLLPKLMSGELDVSELDL